MARIILFSTLVCLSCSLTTGIVITPARVKRGFFQPSTIIKYKTVELIKLVPKACIYMDPDLPDCNNVRTLPLDEAKLESRTFWNLQIPLAETTKKEISNRIDVEPEDNTTISKPTNQFNGNWFMQLFIRDPVVVEEIIYKPKIVEDPNIAVTYHIKDCKPQNLPPVFKGLENCEGPPMVDDPKKIVPTHTVLGLPNIKPTKIPQEFRPIDVDQVETTDSL